MGRRASAYEGPRHIKRRIIGIEIELGMNKLEGSSYYPTSIVGDLLSRLLAPYVMREVIRPDFVRNISGRHFLPNQAQCYCDRNSHFEYATPECLGPREAALYETAGCVVIAEALRLLRTVQPQLQKIRFYKNNRNCEYWSPVTFRDTWATHANFLTAHRISFERLRRHLLPFLLTRSCLIGNGWLDLAPEGHINFLLSQRSSLITAEVGPDTIGENKAFINTRDEPHADGLIWRRVHDISGNSNMSEWQLRLKYGTYDLMLMMVETDGFLPALSPIHDGRILTMGAKSVFFNTDIRSRRPVFLANGRRWNALDFQWFYIEEAHRYFREGRGPLTEERGLTLELWERTVDAVARWDLPFLAGILDWAALLYYYLMPLFERLGLNIERFLAPLPRAHIRAPYANIRHDTPVATKKGTAKLINYLLHLFVEYANVETKGSLYGLLKERGFVQALFSPEEILWAMDSPPSRTRAAWRETIFRWLEDAGRVQGFELQNAAWDNITIRQRETPAHPNYSVYKPLYNSNPYLYRVREIEQGRPLALLRVSDSQWG